MQVIQRVRNACCVRYEFIRYNDNNFRIVKLKSAQKKNCPVGLSYIFKFEPGDDEYIEHDKSEIDRQVISRSKKNIRELALCNSFTHFATITVDSKNADRFSLTECQALIRKKLKKLKRINNDFAYIFITEEHKNGAFHFHGLIKGVKDFYVNNQGFLSHKVFDEVGFNSFSEIKDYTKTCNYITKYITKKCIKNESGTIYFSSRGLKKAEKYYIEPCEPVGGWGFDNEYCSIKDYKSCDMTMEELLNTLQIKEEK